MVVAMMFPDKKGPGRGIKGLAAKQFPMVSKTSLKVAAETAKATGETARRGRNQPGNFG
jgi:hypothetical protein